MRTHALGPLNARVLTDGGPVSNVVVLLHGFGATGDDLVGLGQVLDAPEATAFVFPEAPLRLDHWGSRAWWMIDPDLFERRARGERVDRRGELPPTLPQIRADVSAFLDATLAHFGVDEGSLVLGGFSQGAMVSLDATLHRTRKPRALVLLSGTLIAQSVWTPLLSTCGDLPVFQSHGARDPLLPFEVAEELRDLLRGAGAAVQFVPFSGEHEIPAQVLSALSRFLSAPA